MKRHLKNIFQHTGHWSAYLRLGNSLFLLIYLLNYDTSLQRVRYKNLRGINRTTSTKTMYYFGTTTSTENIIDDQNLENSRYDSILQTTADCSTADKILWALILPLTEFWCLSNLEFFGWLLVLSYVKFPYFFVNTPFLYKKFFGLR